MGSGDMLAIIFFSIFFGIALLIEIKDSPDVVKFIDQMNRVVMRMIDMVMIFAPYAVFCLVGKAVAELGIDIVLQISGYFMVIIFALLFHAFVTQMIILKAFTGLNVGLFLKKMQFY